MFIKKSFPIHCILNYFVQYNIFQSTLSVVCLLGIYCNYIFPYLHSSDVLVIFPQNRFLVNVSQKQYGTMVIINTFVGLMVLYCISYRCVFDVMHHGPFWSIMLHKISFSHPWSVSIMHLTRYIDPFLFMG